MDLVESKNKIVQRHPWESARLEIILDIINQYIPQSGIQKVLDIGCGDCFISEALLKKRKDLVVIGVDTAYTTKEASKISNEKFKLFTNLQEAITCIGSSRVALILLTDVIEHIEHEVEFLKYITGSAFVNNNTHVLITVPAFQSFFTDHDVFLKHYKRYNFRSLRTTVSTSGLIPIQTAYFFLTLLPIRFFQKIKEKAGWKQQQTGIGQWKQGALVTTIFKKFLLFDYRLSKLFLKLGMHLPGLSIYCICKKQV